MQRSVLNKVLLIKRKHQGYITRFIEHLIPATTAYLSTGCSAKTT